MNKKEKDISKDSMGTDGAAGAPGDRVIDREDAVWVLSSMYDAVTDRSCMAVFDGEKVGQGPIATVWLDHQLPHSLHGSFTPQTFI